MALRHLSLSCAGKTSFFDNTIPRNVDGNEGAAEKAWDLVGSFAGKPAPTGTARNPVGAGLPAKKPARSRLNPTASARQG
ncbi:hypothetical protein C6A77_15370 [Pseudomonas sp. AFG_SD02_1510_Pfu_092]|nr:hypothetical protein C6A77_15370 [Pseudomonas sp. AFG_SD02_1510_Pfu_092]